MAIAFAFRSGFKRVIAMAMRRSLVARAVEVGCADLWSLAAECAPAPGQDLVGDLVCCARRGVERVYVPLPIARTETTQALPPHRGPTICGQDMGHVVWIPCVGAHPTGECLVVGKQSRGIATLSEPRGLRVGVDVEKTDGNRVELAGRWCGDHLAGSYRIPGEQEVPTDRLKRQGALHDGLRGLLPPGDRRSWRDADDVTELDALDLRS